MDLELISFKLCPYVQRSVITLNYKKAKYRITYIDLEEPPSWFAQISPLGKVPLLKVDGSTVLFESAVINEYLDEVLPPRLHPTDPLRKAYERAWIEFGSELLMENYSVTMETDESRLRELKEELFTDLIRLEGAINSRGPYFRGPDFSLVDAAYAPLFMRLFLFASLAEDPAWEKMPKVKAWGRALLEVPAVKDSVVPEFAQLYRDYCAAHGSLLR